MKIISYTALHYGREYLGYALKSVIDYVDEAWILYTDIGSHGFRTATPCPESRAELYTIASAVCGDKLRWVDGRWDYEGQQRDAIMQHCPDADAIIVLDADEIWTEGVLANYFENVVIWASPVRSSRIIRVPMVHYWRSFYRCVLHDPAFPERIIHPKNESQSSFTLGIAQQHGIQHMGYAQTPGIVNYKQLTHGHRGQWRESWFDTIFMDETRRTDLHPVGSDYWNVEDVNPWDYLPDFMRHHPFAEMDVIR